MAQTILVVDDKPNVCIMLKNYLIEQGFRVETALNGRQALFAARDIQPDLVLLDIIMPEVDGYEFIRKYRQVQSTPIIIISGKLEESDKVIGLELGADDYVTKPISLKELVARIRAVLRRSKGSTETENLLRVADVVLDRNRQRVDIGNRSVNLTRTEFELLAILLAEPGRVYSRTQLQHRLHGVALESQERTIDVHIHKLRTKIGPDPKNPRYIETVFGIGYRFVADWPHNS